MLSKLIAHLAGKKICILGFGREGQSSYRFLRQHLPDQTLWIADQKPDFWQENQALTQDERAVCLGGADYLAGLDTYDIIIKTPGISFVGLDTSSFIDKVTSQLELALEFLDIKTIGVTGTKGKSTTSSLIYQMLYDQDPENVILRGNIGTPMFDGLDELRPGMTVVLEMSAHQLEYMHCSPHIAILLNLFEEHLDHFGDFEHYAQAKCHIFQYQTAVDYFIYSADNSHLRSYVQHPAAQVYRISLTGQPAEITLRGREVYAGTQAIFNADAPRELRGDYNLSNIMFALAVAEILQLDLDRARQTIAHFQTLHHRLEFVGEYDHILYYDNAIATVPAATIAAIEALGNVDTLIIGGMDRGLNYDEFADYLNRSAIRHIICMPVTGHQIASRLAPEKVQRVTTLAEAVAAAKRLTAPGMACLLSPAAASYNDFKNFEDKGDQFQQLVRA